MMHRITIMSRLYVIHGGDDVPEVAQVVSDLLESISLSGGGKLDSEQVAVIACVHLASLLHAVEK
jgi:hypothetical protein